jgi:drug/metabolite transporter (DMT)-like permease
VGAPTLHRVGRPYLVLGGVTAGWGTIPVLVGLVDLPSPLIVAIRLWTAALCLGAVLAVGEWRARRAGRARPPEGPVSGGAPAALMAAGADRMGSEAAAAAGAPRSCAGVPALSFHHISPTGGAYVMETSSQCPDMGTDRASPGGPVGDRHQSRPAGGAPPSGRRASRSGAAEGAAGGAPRLLSVQPLRCALSAVVLGAHWLALFAAYKRAPAGTVILIVYLAPIGVAALAPRLLGERLGRGTVTALAAAVVGFGLLAGPTVHSAGATGLALSLVAAVLFVVLILLSKPLAEVYGGLRLAFLELAGAGLVLVPVAAATTWPPVEAAWLWVVVLGVVHTALGISLYLRVLAEIPATHVGILGYLEPVVVVLAAWLWLGQRPATVTVIGGLFVIAAGVSVAVSASPGGRGVVDAAFRVPDTTPPLDR